MPGLKGAVLFVGPPRSVHFERWTIAAARYGLDVHATGRADSFDGAGEFFPLPQIGGRLGYLLAVPFLSRLIDRLHPTVIHAHYATSYGAMTALAAPRSIPVVLTCWGSDVLIDPSRSRLLRSAAKIALRRATLVSSMAFHMTDRLLALGVPPKRILTLPFGADLETFTCHGARDIRYRLITTRALEPQYNGDLLLRALAALRDRSGAEPLTAVIGG